MLRPTPSVTKPIPMKLIAYLHSEFEIRVVWEEDEIKQMIIKENLEYAFHRKIFL